jgi:hypothetical protein
MSEGAPPRPTPAEVPPGWDYNPSTWAQRLPIVGLAILAFAAATHLALYQLRVIGKPWEPFFGDGSRIILDSWVSRLLPVSDAALGALSYLLDAVAGLVGGRHRWRTMPWIVVHPLSRDCDPGRFHDRAGHGRDPGQPAAPQACVRPRRFDMARLLGSVRAAAHPVPAMGARTLT